MIYEMKYVMDNSTLDRVLRFSDRILKTRDFSKCRLQWQARMTAHPELLVYAQVSDEVVAVALAYLEDNGNITVGVVATEQQYRKQGLARECLSLIENRAKDLGVHLIALGSVDSAVEFYEKLGYTSQLLIQSPKHTVDELLSLNPGFPILFTNIYDGTTHQLCLKLTKADSGLRQIYENTFDDCDTQIMCWKAI